MKSCANNQVSIQTLMEPRKKKQEQLEEDLPPNLGQFEHEKIIIRAKKAAGKT